MLHFESGKVKLSSLTKKILIISGFSRRSSFDYGEGSKESEIVVLKERRLIPTKPVREGMQRFNLLLEVCVPGTVPDAQLIGAIMDLVIPFFQI